MSVFRRAGKGVAMYFGCPATRKELRKWPKKGHPDHPSSQSSSRFKGGITFLGKSTVCLPSKAAQKWPQNGPCFGPETGPNLGVLGGPRIGTLMEDYLISCFGRCSRSGLKLRPRSEPGNGPKIGPFGAPAGKQPLTLFTAVPYYARARRYIGTWYQPPQIGDPPDLGWSGSRDLGTAVS